ncbi:hypothetical protein RN001_008421 [Aquatica leii]|uniref:Uncharacterized protein n=1 Tax=Aquatica leii TaxID=1421715 RepID=A0AAN7SRC4_9COLE|nr:hypothetical protein RN001_008421 [Aquatica leii]
MSSKPEWSCVKSSEDYCKFLNTRESGDGESKETSPHTSASEEDPNDPIQSLIDVNRKTERKKVSKIPVRQTKVSHNADVTKSTYGNNLYYQQLGPAEKAEVLYQISDLEQPDPIINKIDSIAVGDEDTLKVEISSNSDRAEMNELTNAQHDCGIQKESIASSLESILEAPEEFRSLTGKILSTSGDTLINNKDECGTKVDEMSPTDIGEPCRTVAAIRDHDNISKPEANTCGWDLNRDVGNMPETEIETYASVDENMNANTKSAAPFETNMHSSGDCQLVVTIDDSGELKHNDQIQSTPEFNAVQHERICDNKSMIGVLSNAIDSLLVIDVVANAPTKILNESLVDRLNVDGKGSSFPDVGYPEGRDSVNELEPSVSNNGAYACAGNEQTLTAVKPSIAIGVERCAQAPRCSRISVATACAASTLNSSKLTQNIVTEKGTAETSPTNEVTTDANKTFNLKSENASVNSETHLFWTFKNGRLVFEAAPVIEVEDKPGQSSRPIEEPQSELDPSPRNWNLQEFGNSCDDNETELTNVLFSRDLNRRVTEGPSRLKHLENKLKKAGITDGKSSVDFQVDDQEKIVLEKQVVDKLTQPLLKLNSNSDVHCENDLKSKIESEFTEDLLPEGNGSGDQVDFAGGSLCEFDVRQVGAFSGYNDSEFFLVYDELENSSDEDECEYEHYRIIDEMRGDGSMGTDGERGRQHNPDRENLKSLLKKPGRGRDVKKNRVVFNENKNEFFDADYIILIREECDYDDEEDDGVCTCNDHEMVRLTCCEPNCNCNLYEGYSSDPTPQSPKFAPPLEFVDAVTLSPPEGYKDMELGEQQLLALQQMAMRGQRAAVCRDCSATHEDDGEGSQSDNEEHCDIHSDQEEIREETIKTDQSQQTTPTTPLPADNGTGNSYLSETVAERQVMREDDDKRSISPSHLQIGSPISGILKGGRLWKQHSQDLNNFRNIELQQATDSSITSDEESNGNKRSVRFTESNENKRDVCDGAADKPTEEISKEDDNQQKDSLRNANSASPESTEMLLTLKLGNHILISNNSLKPNSAVRQLFPCSKPLSSKPGENDSVHQYLVTAESLRAFEEAKRSKLPQIIQSDETDESIKRAIERNTLRRSLIRYEPRPKKKEQKSDNSLVEQIKKLTCDVDDVIQETDDIQHRASPPGEEARKSPEVNHLIKPIDKSFSPSSSSTASSNSSSVSSTYKRITDLFAKREKQIEIQGGALAEPNPKGLNQLGPAPDLGNSGPQQEPLHHCPITKSNSTNDTRKQFLSTLAPLTACVSSVATDDHYYHISHHIGDRASITSSVGTEYSLEDIDEGLKNEDDDSKRNAPDVVVGTPSASESGDELAMFVQQDASRIERIKKKYQQDSEDDEHDDYGFNKRPSVRGIKPRFGTTTEILQQIQNQMQPMQTTAKTNPHVAWPYYSEASLSGLDNNKSHNINQNVPQYQYTYVTEEMKTKMYIQHYRPTSLVDDNIYQNCSNQRCNRDVAYKTNANHVYSPVMRIGGGCSEFYNQPVPVKSRNGRPESPPPFDVARNVHQTMVYIPYNHIESYQPACVSPNPQYVGSEKCYARVVNQNQINRYPEPVYHNQPRVNQPPMIDINVVKQIPKPMIRLPYPLPNSQAQPHIITSRSESPLPGQFSTARSTQTVVPPMASCNYYQSINPRYRPMVGPVIAHSGVTWNGENVYSNKVNRHSFPSGVPRYPAPDNISLTDSESQYSGQLPNGYRQTIETTFSAQKDSLPNSPTKPRFIERGVPEGAASVSPQDSTVVAQSTSTMTSPTSPQNPSTNPKPLYYAMNV